MKLFIYLSGSIKKGINDNRKKTFWTQEDINILDEHLSDKFELIFLNPSVRNDDLSDFDSTFGRDLLQVYLSDIVLVDARSKKGIGIGAEMAYAKMQGIPVISIVPEESNYYQSHFEYLGQKIDKWIHPFVNGLSDYLCGSVLSAAKFIEQNYPFENEIKNKEVFDKCILHYIDSQLHKDTGMYDIVLKNEEINQKINSFDS